MEIGLTQHQQQVIEKAQAFSKDVLAPQAEETDQKARMNVEALKVMANMGFMTLTVPQKEGGKEVGTVAYAMMMRAFARGCASTTIAVSVTNMVANAIHRWGTQAQKEKYFEFLNSGKAITAAYAMTENGAGSDVSAMKTTVVRDGDDFILNGTKQFITSGAVSGFTLLFAMTNIETGSRGITAFIIDKGTAGLSIGKTEDKMGLRGSNTVELVLNNCRIPNTAQFGKEGKGFPMALSILDGGRVSVAAQSVGIGEAALEAARQYTQERKQFGKRLGDQPVVRTALAEMRLKLEAAWLLTLHAAKLQQAGKPFTKEASMAKVFASEEANRVCVQAVQLMGAEGLKHQQAIQRYFRDCKVKTLYEGTSEIQRIVISRQILKG